MTLRESLVGKTIVGVGVSPGAHDLRFRLEGENAVVWSTEGDCCSESWWADIFELNALVGTVTGVEEIDLPVPVDDRGRQECDVAYGVKVTTAIGTPMLVYRNSSNGYYGGWACVASDHENIKWVELTGNDWSS